MADITITGVNDKASDENFQGHPKIVFTLSEAPDEEWIEYFNKARATQATLVNMLQSAQVSGANLTAITKGTSVAAQNLLDELKKAVAATNKGKNSFHEQLKNLKF